MIRILFAAAVLAANLTPGAAAEPTLDEQYAAAQAVFLGGIVDRVDFLTDYRKRLFENLEGRWFAVGVLETLDAEAVAKLCARAAVVTVRDEYTFEMVRSAGAEAEFSTIFTSRSGSAFGQYTEPKAVLAALGLDKLDNEQIAMTALNGYNGIANITRASADILVIQPNLGPPELWGRCPEVKSQ